MLDTAKYLKSMANFSQNLILRKIGTYIQKNCKKSQGENGRPSSEEETIVVGCVARWRKGRNQLSL
jgi:hypothetical protein